ncbi:hypothetical protein FACS1894188_09480 [Clostridia bacterium]|nr:hypothetical protein FACS1894188_09480 [Clostridia bacterium]
MLFSTTVFAAEQTEYIDAVFGQIKVYVNGQKVNKETLLYNGTTYVPLRATAEILKKQVNYDELTRTASINSIYTEYPEDVSTVYYGSVRNEVIFAYFGWIKLVVDGKNVAKETLLYEGTTYVPLRATAELLNMDVTYQESTQSALLTDKSTIVHVPIATNYTDFPTVLDFGVYASVDKPTKSIDGNVTVYKYLLSSSSVIVKNYVTEITKLGFTKDTALTTTGSSVYVKDNVSVTIDINTVGYVIIRLQKITVNVAITTVYSPDFPSIRILPNHQNRTSPTDGNGFIYWYKNIEKTTVTEYLKILIKDGYKQDSANTKDGYYVYLYGDYSVTVDTLSQKGYVLIIIINLTTSVNTIFSEEFPRVPILPNPGKTENDSATGTGNGVSYHYYNINDSTIQEYIRFLISAGFKKDSVNTRTGYYVYDSTNIFIVIEVRTTEVVITIAPFEILDSTEFAKIPILPNPDIPLPPKAATGLYTDIIDILPKV